MLQISGWWKETPHAREELRYFMMVSGAPYARTQLPGFTSNHGQVICTQLGYDTFGAR